MTDIVEKLRAIERLADEIEALRARVAAPDEVREAVIGELANWTAAWVCDEKAADAVLAVIPATEERPGFDQVWLPVDVVDIHAHDWHTALGDACREAVARRKPVAPTTERVKLWESVGRKVPGNWKVTGWEWSTERGGYIVTDHGDILLSGDQPEVIVLVDGT